LTATSEIVELSTTGSSLTAFSLLRQCYTCRGFEGSLQRRRGLTAPALSLSRLLIAATNAPARALVTAPNVAALQPSGGA